MALLQEEDDLQDMMTRVFQEGLEGLVLKDVKVRIKVYFIFINHPHPKVSGYYVLNPPVCLSIMLSPLKPPDSSQPNLYSYLL